MVIGERVKFLREQKNMSQGDIEKRTGLVRCYVSRVENGHTVPSIDTLERLATALKAPMNQCFSAVQKGKQGVNFACRASSAWEMRRRIGDNNLNTARATRFRFVKTRSPVGGASSTGRRNTIELRDTRNPSPRLPLLQIRHKHGVSRSIARRTQFHRTCFLSSCYG